MDSSNEHIKTLERNIEDFETNVRRRVWISSLVRLFLGILFLAYTIWQIGVYGQRLVSVQVELTQQTGELDALKGTLEAIQGELEQSNQNLNELKVTSTAAASELEANKQELNNLGIQLTQTTDDLLARSDFLAYSIQIDRFESKEAFSIFQYPAQADLFNYVLELQEKRIPFNGTGFSEREGFNSPNFAVYVMQKCGIVNPGYGADAKPSSMLPIINESMLSIGDIVVDELSGYSMFYFETPRGEKFLIGMTPAGILAVKPEFILTPLYFHVPYESIGVSQCESGF